MERGARSMKLTSSSLWRPLSLWGPVSPPGLALALIALLTDQMHKYWMVHIYELGNRGRVTLTPFFDLVMVWNPGVSYGLFAQDGIAGKLALVGFALLICAALIFWLARQTRMLPAIAIGLIIGGALGNAIDRLIYGAVADFFSLHAFGYHWYVFNLADIAIVLGAAGLVYDALFLADEEQK